MMKKRWATALILIFAFCGIAVSTYLAQSEANGNPLICDINGNVLDGCNVVVSSEYSKLFGISLADFGLLFYTIVFVLAAFELALVNQVLRHTLQGFAVVGILASLYGIITQAIFIEAYCIYCLTSALLTAGILICATFIEPIRLRPAPATS